MEDELIATLVFVLAMECPLHAAHMKAAGVESRHDTFGFSHETSHHTFTTSPDGGAIELRTDDASETKAIRAHLRSIAKAFADGDFSKPQFVHAETPPGVATMQRLKKSIRYRYEELPNGARVRITTANSDALDAVHEFLQYQKREH